MSGCSQCLFESLTIFGIRRPIIESRPIPAKLSPESLQRPVKFVVGRAYLCDSIAPQSKRQPLVLRDNIPKDRMLVEMVCLRASRKLVSEPLVPPRKWRYSACVSHSKNSQQRFPKISCGLSV